MARHFPGRALFNRIEIETDLGTTPAAGVTSVPRGLMIQRETLTLAVTISLLAANDYGSVKLVDLPAGNLIIVGAKVDIAGTVAGMTTNTIDQAHVSLGTVATASNSLGTAGCANIVPSTIGVVTTGAAGTFKGMTTTTEKLLYVANAANSIYLSAIQAVTSGTGTITITGTVELDFLTLGAPS